MKEIKFKIVLTESYEDEDENEIERNVIGNVLKILWDTNEINVEFPSGNCEWYDLDSNKQNLLEYTGLKDKNGKEIYEGNVIDFYINGNEKDGKDRGYIVYSERRAAFMIKLLNTNARVLLCSNIPQSIGLVDPDNNCKIIGNIYENAELLKVSY